MEILEKLLTLIVDKVPSVAAETVLAMVSFLVCPYRAAIRLVAFARRNRLPTQLFVALSLIVFMLAFGFSQPFSRFDVRTVSQASILNNKIDLFYVIVYGVGLASLVALMHLVIEKRSSFRYPVLFRDLYYVSVALVIPWFAIILALASLAMTAILDSTVPSNDNDLIRLFVLIGPPFAVFGLLIATAPTLIFAIQSDLRWYRASSRYRRAIRILPIYVSTIVILVLMPLYFMYLGDSLYPIGLEFTTVCFTDKDTLYITVSVENRTQKTYKVHQLFIKASAYSESAPSINLEGYLIELPQPILFNGLKENAIVKPQETNRFRLKIVLKNEEWVHPTMWFCSLSEFGGAERGEKTISSSDTTIEFLH